jgi:formate dehydrogenase subunit gamma
MNEVGVLPDGRIVRYTYRERLMHWSAGVSYVYLLLSGLAFWSPWLFWLAAILGGPTIARELHPWIGLIFTLAVLWMYGVWRDQMRTTPEDRAWWRALRHYIRNEDAALPPEGRYNGGQKALFWGFIWCAIVLLLSGLVLWFPHWIPWGMRWLRLAAVILHPIAALVTIALFMIHVYMGVFVERGALQSMVEGDVSPAWAKKHHRAWYEQIVRGSTARE